MQTDTEQDAPLAPQYAFVVQFRADTQVETEQITGRVEHVVSRQATTFQSLEALLAFMSRVLREVRQTAAP